MRGRDRPGMQAARRVIPLAGLALLLLTAVTSTAATVMYRFENADGTPVYSYTLPAEQARYGYQRIDPQTGRVLETVAPQLPPHELAEKLRREQALTACRDELERIYNLYGAEADIDRALATALESLETRIGQLQANLRQAQREQQRLRAQAADVERAGREIPRRLLDNLERSRSQIENLKGEITQRESEQVQARARYTRELERYRDGTCPEPGTVANAGASR